VLVSVERLQADVYCTLQAHKQETKSSRTPAKLKYRRHALEERLAGPTGLLSVRGCR